MARKLAKKKPDTLYYEAMEERVLFSADAAPGLDLHLVHAQALVDDPVSSPAGADPSDLSVAAVRASADSQRELVIVNPDVDDYGQLISDLQSNDPNRIIEVAVLDPEQDGIAQVTDLLAARSDLSAIHFITHGADGQINLGDGWLNTATLQQNADQVATWGRALTDSGDMLFYGCNVAADGEGQSLVNDIAWLTGADVAASDDLTGGAGLGGDWDLEYQAGEIDSSSAADRLSQSGWSHTLATIDVTTTADENDGNTTDLTTLQTTPGGTGISLREAIIAANNTAGADTINLGAGTYNLSITGGYDEDFSAWGDLDIRSDITITGNGIGQTIIDANGIDRVFEVGSESPPTASGTLTLSGLEVAGGNVGFPGGGLYIGSTSTATLNQVDVHNNQTASGNSGGGVYNLGNFSATDSLIRSNLIVGFNEGGGLYNEGTASLERVSVIGNAAGAGGGIGQSNGSLSLTNATVSGNNVGGNGAGIQITGGTFTIDYTTIASNDATSNGSGGGIYFSAGSGSITNSIVADNSAKWSGNDVYGALTSGGNNVVEDYDITTFTPAGTDQTASDPGLAALAMDAGSGQYVHAITESSNAYDAAGGSAPTTDQRGVTRDASPDIGAYEFDANDPPTNTVPGGQSTNEDTALVFSTANGNLISTDDPDAGSDPIEVTLSITNGTLTLNGTTGLTFTTGDGTADADMTLHGTVADINAALDGMTYTPVGDYNGSATLTLSTFDSTLASLNIDASLKGRYTFDDTAALGNDSSPAGGYDGTLNNGATWIDDGTRGTVLSLDGDNDNVQVSGHYGNPANVTLAAWVNLTAADVDGAMVVSLGDSVGIALDNGGSLDGFYYNGINWPQTLYSTTLAGTGWHHVAFTFNDAGNTTALYLDGTLVSSISTPDSISYTQGADTFIGTHGNGSTTWNFEGGIDDVRVYDRVLSASDISVLAADLPRIDTDTVAITVDAVNDAPVLDNSVNLALTSQDEDSGPPSGAVGTTVASLVDLPGSGGSTDNVTDADSGAVTGLAVTAADTTNGSWWYTTDNGSNWYALGSVSSANARLLAADANTRIYFEPDADYNGTVSTAMTYRAWDQTSGSNGGLADTTTNGGDSAFSAAEEQVDLVINPVNDAPGGTDKTISIDEDTVYTFSTADFGFSDVDGNSLSLVYFTTLPAQGQLKWNGSTFNPGDYVIAWDIDHNQLTYEPAANANGTAYTTFTFQVQDDGGTTNGGVDQDPTPNTITIDVTPVNDAPAGADKTVTTSEDTAYTFLVTDFGFSDADAGDSLSAVRVDTLPGTGSLALNGSPVTAGQVVTAANITAGNLVFTPVASTYGAAYTSFTFSVSDLGGAYDGAPNTITVDVIAAGNLAPTDIGLSAASVNQSGGTNAVVGSLTTTDADTGDSHTYTLVAGTGDTDNASFNISGSQLRATDAGALAAGSYSVRIQTDDGNGGTYAKVFSITVVDDVAPAAPTDGDAAADSVTEGAATGTAVGLTARSSDSPASAITYDLTDDAGGRFQIDAVTGVVTVADGSLLDYEAGTSHNITVRATDAAGNQSTQVFAISVANAAPTAVDDSATTGENTVLNVAAGSGVLGNDTDPNGFNGSAAVSAVNGTGGNVGAAVAGSNCGSFTVNADGSYAFDPGTDFDDLAMGDSRVTTVAYTLTDGTTTDTATLTVTVDGVNDAPLFGGDTSAGVAEDGTLTATGVLTISDADTGEAVFTAQSAAASANGYGTVELDSAGNWSYALDNANATVQSLSAGQTLTDSFTAVSADGSAQVVTITITGADDGAGGATGTVTDPGADTGSDDPGSGEINDAYPQVPTDDPPPEYPPIEISIDPVQERPDDDGAFVSQPFSNTDVSQAFDGSTDGSESGDAGRRDGHDDRVYGEDVRLRELYFSKHTRFKTAEYKQVAEPQIDLSQIDAGSQASQRLDMQGAYDAFRVQLDQAFGDEKKSLAFRSKMVFFATATLTAGVVTYLLRASSLLSSLLFSLPAWHRFDPIAVFAGKRKKRKDARKSRDADQIQSETFFDGGAQ